MMEQDVLRGCLKCTTQSFIKYVYFYNFKCKEWQDTNVVFMKSGNIRTQKSICEIRTTYIQDVPLSDLALFSVQSQESKTRQEEILSQQPILTAKEIANIIMYIQSAR